MVFLQVLDSMRVNVDKVLERDQKLSELDEKAGKIIRPKRLISLYNGIQHEAALFFIFIFIIVYIFFYFFIFIFIFIFIYLLFFLDKSA